MTNAELIAKIKAEIERRTKSLRAGICNEEVFTRKQRKEMLVASEELDRFNRFLSTLESEKPMNLDDAMKELDEKIALVKERGTWDGVDVDKYMDEVRGREPEKPTNLEEEINRYLEPIHTADIQFEPFTQMTKCARHFAEWGYLRAAEKYNEIEYNRQRAEESVLNDLEEAAKEYAKTTFKRPYSDNPDEDVTIVEPDKYAGFIAGAKWMSIHGNDIKEL